MNSNRSFRVSVVLAAALICFLCVTTVSRAENKAGATTVSIFGGGYKFDDDTELKDGWTGGLGLGYNLTEHWGLELLGNYIDTEFKKHAEVLEMEPIGQDGDGVIYSYSKKTDLKAYLYRLELQYNFQPESWFVPYLAVGAGGITYDPEAFDGTRISLPTMGLVSRCLSPRLLQ
jgi:OmpA-OmpF porin, OOP family